VSQVLELAGGQLLALLAFFGFPAFQYALLKWFSKRDGQPELSYHPSYGFRLAIRNLPQKKTLSQIRYRALLRKDHADPTGSRLRTCVDKELLEREDYFLFPEADQILLNFRLVRSSNKDLQLVQTDLLGQAKECEGVPLESFDRLVCDYSATIENFLNFDIRIARRVEIRSSSLCSMLENVEKNNREREFSIETVRIVG
jgi:hypothetical protein